MILNYKGYIIKPHQQIPTNVVISTEGKGGKIPNVMAGLFTSPSIAKQVVDRYVEDKEPEDDKKISKRGI